MPSRIGSGAKEQPGAVSGKPVTDNFPPTAELNSERVEKRIQCVAVVFQG